MRIKFRYILGGIRLVKEKFLNNRRLKLSGIKYYLGKNVRINTEKNGKCFLGTKNWMDDNCYLSAKNATISIGYNNFFNVNCRVIAMAGITIGDNNLFGPNVVIVDHNHGHSSHSLPMCRQPFSSTPIVLGSDIWIGANVVICEGVSICDHVIVGANAVVTKSINETGVYAGLPAKKIGDI